MHVQLDKTILPYTQVCDTKTNIRVHSQSVILATPPTNLSEVVTGHQRHEQQRRRLAHALHRVHH